MSGLHFVLALPSHLCEPRPARLASAHARSCDWQLVWYCTPMSRPPGLTVRGAATSMSIWRPLGPPGYAALGDVAVGGLQPPAQPVRMYKDLALSDGDAPGEGRRLVAPVGYALVFRDSGEPPLTLWRPVAPRGYAEVRGVGWRG